MGKFEKGILGHFDGKVGTVIGARWKGVEYMKSKNRKSNKPPTIKQLRQQAKFGLMTRFTAALSDLMRTSFNDPADKMTGVNLAVAKNIRTAITGDYPAYSIDYPNVQVSKGDLLNVYNPVAAAIGGGKLQFTWVYTPGPASAGTDRAILVAYCPETNEALYSADAVRQEQAGDIDAILFTGKLVHTWIYFLDEENGDVSSSAYAGAVTVS